MKKINLILLTILSLLLLLGVNAATVSHPASEITAGTFPAGDFTFQGNVEFQRNNEVFLNIRNTEASGRQYALVSAGSSGGIGIGKFSVYDKTADASRLAIDSSGNVGIGVTNPTQRLEVSGNVKATSFVGDGSQLTGIQGVPSGAVMFFNLPSCPSGWTELTSARGRYIVGLQSGGSLGGTVGTALSGQENRPAGEHSHSVQTRRIFGTGGNWAATDQTPVTDRLGPPLQTESFGIAGTNAPYIQLLVCQKN
ncbi:MAG: hypothetical protein Q8R04_00050 [Nanoarchaeota archaeon]|nr:hypothetical protein [Nanoarchaeota archaeon]